MEHDFIDTLLSRVADRGDEETVSDPTARLTGREFIGLVGRTAALLESKADIARGDVVGIRTSNTVFGLAIRYAVYSLGAVLCQLPNLGPTRQRDLLKAVNPSIIVTDHLPLPSQAEPAFEAPVVELSSPGPGEAGHAHISRSTRYEPDDIALLSQTGGTTGTPKLSYKTAKGLAVGTPAKDPQARRLITTFLAYFAGPASDAMLGAGGSVVFAPQSAGAAEIVKLIADERITHMFMVEPKLAGFIAELQLHRPPGFDQSIATLRQLLHMGASAPAEFRIRAHALLGDKVVHAYGSSELGGGITSTFGQPFNAYTTGPVLPGARCRIIAEDGKEAPKGVVGIIECANHVSVDGGYWNAGQKSPFGEWFRSSDRGYFDQHDQLVMAGRDSDLIAETVMPPVLEDAALRASSTVSYVVVVPSPSPEADAYVFLQTPRPQDEQQVSRAIAEEFPKLRLVFITLSKLPLTEQGKPDRLKLVEHYPQG